jgi:hypothetical protein
MANGPQVAIDPFGFGRLAEMNLANRRLDIQEQDAARRGQLLDLQVQAAQGEEQSRLGKLKRQQDMQTGLQQALANIPEGENQFSATHQFLAQAGFQKEADALLNNQLAQIEKVDKVDPIAADNLFNETFGKVHGLTAEHSRDLDPEKFKNESSLRKEFVKNSGEFIKSRDSVGRVRAAGADPSAAGDLALIFNFMKVLDPGSVVRESEFKTASDAKAWVQERAREGKEIPNIVKGALNRVFNGQRLLEDQRADFLNRAERLFAPISRSHEKRERLFRGIAERSGFNVDNVVLDLKIGEVDEEGAATTETTAVETPTGAAQATTVATTEQPAAAGFKVLGVR